MPSEAELLALAARGDMPSWERLVSLHEAYALGLARNRLRRAGFGGAEAEEVVQEVWIKLLKGLAGVDASRGFRPYLARAVLNAARDWLRAHARRSGREAEYGASRPSPEAPDEPLLRQEDAERLTAALKELAPRERLLLRLVYWQGLPYAATARVLGISVNGIGPLLSQARARLRDILGKS